ncbi:uncharacterized protein N7482_000190 [Penicillium canariense]|uniref:Dynactin subunit 6 n=1 Tax=Penicillium canariense TaxID=189055 RepID=A0A9W9ICV6_9EURO|nr:uncharacterized protein N7482_000190 [Penicillium canariense]KAJ5174313.1 hypothetical protein N7482_000190 [Penicillium canariense]
MLLRSKDRPRSACAGPDSTHRSHPNSAIADPKTPPTTAQRSKKHNTAMATLKPPSAQRRSSSSHPPAGPPKAPLKADASATIADTAVFQGTYPITIGAGTVIHPRARFYAFEGPISVGDGCIVSEKAIIGAAPGTSRSTGPSPSASTGPSPTSSSTNVTSPASQVQGHKTATRISYFVTIGPHSTVLPGATVHSSATVESLVTINRYADIGAHSKICSGCQIPANGCVPEWTVVWGSGVGQRRKRARGAKEPAPAVVVAAQVAQIPVPPPAPEGKVIEDARLMVLQKEREVLERMIVPAGATKKK